MNYKAAFWQAQRLLLRNSCQLPAAYRRNMFLCPGSILTVSLPLTPLFPGWMVGFDLILMIKEIIPLLTFSCYTKCILTRILYTGLFLLCVIFAHIHLQTVLHHLELAQI